jgi:5-formyltetrahydrofolate cyclo-ligase
MADRRGNVMASDEEDFGASAPCLLNELQQSWDGSYEAVNPQQSQDVARWRKAERERLIALRLAVPVAEREAMDARIADALVDVLSGAKCVSFYWPFRGEPDLRGMMGPLTEAGVTCALPVVVEKRQPLNFRAYAPGDALDRGVWNIPFPAVGAEVEPDTLLSPVVGFDDEGFRLGYGGGFFDRTMMVADPQPRLIGVGYDLARLPTIFPQPHDRPLDLVVTETGIFTPDR